MFPTIDKYIENPYIKLNVYMEIRDPKKLEAIENNAKNIIKLMRHGVKFTPTQPDIMRIEQIMQKELEKDLSLTNV